MPAGNTDKFNVCPEQRALLFVAVTTGFEFTTTVVCPVFEHPVGNVTVTVYTPEAAEVTLVIEGFCVVLVKLFGPAQLYVPPAGKVAKFNVCPAHTGPLLEAVIVGKGFITTVVCAVPEQPVAKVTVTLNVPEKVRAFKIIGF